MVINKFLIIVIILIASGCLFWFLVMPQYNQFKVLQSELIIKEAEYNAKYAYYAEVLRLFSELEKKQEGLSKIDKALPDEISLSPIIYFIQKKTQESGLIAKDLFFTKISNKDNKESIKDINFSLSVIGSYTSLKNFLYALERSANLFETRSISFSSSSMSNATSKSSQTYSFLLDIKTNSY